jgi:hypothetical protein
MAKQTGIGARLYAQNYDLSGDVGAVDSIAMSRAQLDVTGIDKEFYERLPGIGDASLSFTGFFNRTNAHAALSPMGTGAKVVSVAFSTAIGAPTASISASQETYNTTRGPDGSLTVQSAFQSFAGYGVEWGALLTAGGTVSATGTATSTVDNTAASTAGAAAYLHVFSVTAGTVTVTVQASADNAAFTAVSGLAFTATAAGTAERVATASGAAIARYTRYNVAGGTAVIAATLHRG